MKRPDLSRLAPPGFGLRTELQLFGTGSALAVLYSTRYPVRFHPFHRGSGRRT